MNDCFASLFQEKAEMKLENCRFRITLTFPMVLLEKQIQQHQLVMSYLCSGVPSFPFQWLEPEQLMKMSFPTWGLRWLSAAAENKDTNITSPTTHEPRRQKLRLQVFGIKLNNEILGLKKKQVMLKTNFYGDLP